MKKDMKLGTLKIIKNISSTTLLGIRSSKSSSLIVIVFIPIMVLKKTNLAWLKSNMQIG
jgi:hypothetical protein